MVLLSYYCGNATISYLQYHVRKKLLILRQFVNFMGHRFYPSRKSQENICIHKVRANLRMNRSQNAIRLFAEILLFRKFSAHKCRIILLVIV